MPFRQREHHRTRFTGRPLREEAVDNVTAVFPEICGNAYVTGFQQFIVDHRDPVKFGFHLAGATP
jgi:proline racemase